MDAHPNFTARHPRSTALRLKPVETAGAQHAGFDIDEVELALGPNRFAALMQAKIYTSGVPANRQPGAIQLFSCGHRNWPQDHPEELKQGSEVHCVYAHDLETFLAQEK